MSEYDGLEDEDEFSSCWPLRYRCEGQLYEIGRHNVHRPIELEGGDHVTARYECAGRTYELLASGESVEVVRR